MEGGRKVQPEIRQLIESIVRELAHTLQPEPVEPRNVLYMFCDSTAHEAYTDHFIRLKQAGMCHDILFLDGESSSWWGKHKIECGGAGKMIALDEYAPAPLELPLQYDAIVIPELDLDQAARIARGMKGTVKSEVVFAALLLGKYVIVGDDAAGLKRADRRTLKLLELTAPYRQLLSQYKKELAALGVHFAPQRQLADAVVHYFATHDLTGPAAEAAVDTDSEHKLSRIVPASAAPESDSRSADTLSDGKQSSIVYEGKLVSAEWVERHWGHVRSDVNSGGPRLLQVGKGTIISPLAKDQLRQSGVTIRYI